MHRNKKQLQEIRAAYRANNATKKTWFMMSSQNGVASIDIYDEIGAWGVSAGVFKDQLTALGEVKELTLRMNSNGGAVSDGIVMYNLLREHPAHKTVVVDGMAASIASVICMACDTVEMQQASFMMIHNPTLLTMGNAGQLRQDADVLDMMKSQVIVAYQKKSGLSVDEISALMDGDDGADGTWMAPEDCVEYGFADFIRSDDDEESDIYDSLMVHKNLKFPDNKTVAVPQNILDVLERKQPVMRMCAARNKIPVVVPVVVPENKDIETGATTVTIKEELVMKCPACGKDVSAESATFCNHCGANMKTDPTVAMKVAHDREKQEAREKGAKDELERIEGIRMICKKHNLPADFEAEQIKNKVTLDAMAKVALDKVAEMVIDPVKPVIGAFGKDEADKYRNHAVLSLMQSGGVQLKPEDAKQIAGQERPNGLHGIVKMALVHEGAISQSRLANLGAEDIADEAIRLLTTRPGARMESSSELPSILADVANKTMLRAWELSPMTYRLWTKTIEAKDFKTLHMIKMSEFSDISDIAEGADFTYGRVSDKQETLSISTKGKAFMLTRKAIINDDLGALTQIPAKIVNSVERRKNKDLYDLLVSNALLGPTMTEDGVNLFNAASHFNLRATSGVVTHAAIGANEVALLQMPLPKPDDVSSTQYSGVVPKYLITGTQNKTAIRQLLGATYDLGSTYSAVTQAPNLFGDIIPIFDPYLQAALTAAGAPNAWYMACDPTLLGHFTIAYLNGQSVPYLRSMPTMVGQALGVKWDVFMEWGYGVEDSRGIIYNDGK